ncbi:MAG: hypothetical protein IPH48_08320 [bacterium]|jgi:hypothetical protein|nr:hypothetical protein [bacterium]MBK9777039.1 hypothetical protein [bacterium]
MPAELAQTLLISHKGVDLHAATARRVMCDRLAGGDRLANLRRCEFHVFGGGIVGEDGAVPTLAMLLGTGRYYNPNKHRFGHFELESAFAWNEGAGGPLPAGWPGRAVGDNSAAPAGLFDDLLGGPAPAGHTAYDVAAWARGQTGGVVSGTLWRLVVRGQVETARTVGEALAVARSGHEGLLVNPHMECWLVACAAARGC